MARPYLFGTNFKMNQTPAESVAFYAATRGHGLAAGRGFRLYIIPPFTSLPGVTAAAAASRRQHLDRRPKHALGP